MTSCNGSNNTEERNEGASRPNRDITGNRASSLPPIDTLNLRALIGSRRSIIQPPPSFLRQLDHYGNMDSMELIGEALRIIDGHYDDIAPFRSTSRQIPEGHFMPRQ